MKKRSLETTIGAFEQYRLSLSVKVGSHPGTRFLLKPGKKRETVLWKERRETDPHTHMLPLFSLFFFYSCTRTFADAWPQRWTEVCMHSFSHRHYLSGTTYVSYLSFYLNLLQNAHICSQLSHIIVFPFYVFSQIRGLIPL